MSSSPFQTVGVLVRDGGENYPIETLRRLFANSGAQLVLLNEETVDAVDLIIAMGGDGTVLKALEIHPEAPVLAINFGTVGFLTAGDRGDLESLVRRLLDGDYFISDRMLLQCTSPQLDTHVINEIVVRTTSHMVQIEVFVNDARIRTIRGDGVIVGTPMGSTGYLLSTGAPIVMPDVACFVLDGINEYNFSSRAIILSPESQIRLRLVEMRPHQEAWLFKDGHRHHQLLVGEEVHLRRSELHARLIFFHDSYFFNNLASRLSWF